MATNGESARQWLNDNKGKVSAERIQQITQSINQKVEALTPEHPEYDGLLEALDVMEAHLADISNETTAPEASLDQLLDSSPLMPEADGGEEISAEEKQRRFQQLLKKSDM